MRIREAIANGLLLGLDLHGRVCVSLEDDNGEQLRFYDFMNEQLILAVPLSSLPKGVDSLKWFDVKQALIKWANSDIDQDIAGNKTDFQKSPEYQEYIKEMLFGPETEPSKWEGPKGIKVTGIVTKVSKGTFRIIDEDDVEQ